MPSTPRSETIDADTYVSSLPTALIPLMTQPEGPTMPPTQRDDLALALRLLHRLTDTYKCGPPCNAGHGHEAWSWTDHDEPCPTAEAQALLARYGTRVTMSPEMEEA
jgi:hypothetical protein